MAWDEVGCRDAEKGLVREVVSGGILDRHSVGFWPIGKTVEQPVSKGVIIHLV